MCILFQNREMKKTSEKQLARFTEEIPVETKEDISVAFCA